jgi:inner membrane protein
VVALWGIRDYEHRRAVNALDARLYQNSDPIRASAYPYWWNPFRWYGVVETRDFYASMGVDSLAPEVDPEGNMRIRYKPAETPASLAAERSYLGRVYLDWAKYPILEVETRENGSESDNASGGGSAYIVRFEDLRYAYPELAGRATLSATVELDRNLKVVSEAWGSPTGQGRIK